MRKHPKILTVQVRHSSSVKPEVVLICISTCLLHNIFIHHILDRACMH